MSAAAPRLAPDSTLPQRDRLLDPHAVAGLLRELLVLPRSAPDPSCRMLRVKYRLGESLRVVYRVQLGERAIPVALRAFPPGRSAEAFRLARERAVPADPLPAVLHHAAAETVFWAFPNDRKLSNLPRVLGARTSLPELPGLPPLRAQLCSWVPEKGATARGVDARGATRVYAKLYADGTGARIARLHAELFRRYAGCDRALPISRPVIFDEMLRLAVVTRAPGRPLAELADARRMAGTRRLGAALAAFHGIPAPAATQAFRRLVSERVERAAALVARARPDVATAAAELATALAKAASRRTDGAPVLLHGDVHAKNALFDGAQATLIDLDQMGRGPAACDLASFVASLRTAGAFGASDARELAGAFLDGYAAVRPLPGPGTWRWHLAAALLVERALRAVNRVRMAELAGLGALLGEARGLLEEGGRA